MTRAMSALAAVSVFMGAAYSAESTFERNGVTAHRGNSGEYPENTMTALRQGIESGADWIELDIFRTLDGKVVVIHDRTTGRTGDRDLVVAESTYEELRTVDVATDFRKRHSLSLESCPPEHIPLLEEVLEMVLQQNRTRVSIHPKMDIVPDAIELVRRLGAEPWVGFNDSKLAYMAKVKALAPEIKVFWDRPRRGSDLDEDIRIAREHGFEVLVLNKTQVTQEAIDKLQAAGFEVGVWTVNSPENLVRFLDMGMDRIYTDFPRHVLSLLELRELLPRHAY